MKENNQIALESRSFAIRIVNLYKFLIDVKKICNIKTNS